jgi:hypothetical protein
LLEKGQYAGKDQGVKNFNSHGLNEIKLGMERELMRKSILKTNNYAPTLSNANMHPSDPTRNPKLSHLYSN